MTQVWEDPKRWYDEWSRKPWHNSIVDKPQDEFQYYLQADIASVVPGMAGYYNYRDSVASFEDYLKNRGLTYGDVKYPSLSLAWMGASRLGASIMSVPDSIMRLYE